MEQIYQLHEVIESLAVGLFIILLTFQRASRDGVRDFSAREVRLNWIE